ncbi:DUF1330 domain-containing protein [Marispirochaeta aestuarii]|uniref:DUF1330 domain-containing protein n=1 Tax=Marispirochaeta aestuarii TaxID=1963862 RepID=UPI0029C694E0|nr:DUF1330 domain-containing protein [Marispirochaeta aestuarii]
MSVYFLAQIKIIDDSQYQKYLDKCDEIFSNYKGKYLAVDPRPEIMEGEWNYSRSVLIEFTDKLEFDKWYNSEGYQEILKFRLAGAECDSILITGK